MLEAVQYVLVEMILSPNVHNHLKTAINDSGIIPVSEQSTVRDAKRNCERKYNNVHRVSDTYYETIKDGILYNVHRYEYVSMRPYQY